MARRYRFLHPLSVFVAITIIQIWLYFNLTEGSKGWPIAISSSGGDILGNFAAMIVGGAINLLTAIGMVIISVLVIELKLNVSVKTAKPISHRPWFKLSLLTVISMILTVSALLWANMRAYHWVGIYYGQKVDFFGWPFRAYQVWMDNFGKPCDRWESNETLGNVIFCIGIVVLVAISCECSIRDLRDLKRLSNRTDKGRIR